MVDAAEAALIGAAIGASGTLAAQLLVARTTEREAKQRRADARRDELKTVVLRYLDAAQWVEQAAEHRYWHSDLPPDASTRLHNMWLRQKEVELVVPDDLHNDVMAYCNALHEACYGSLPDGEAPWVFLSQTRGHLLWAAKSGLGKLNG